MISGHSSVVKGTAKTFETYLEPQSATVIEKFSLRKQSESYKKIRKLSARRVSCLRCSTATGCNMRNIDEYP